MKKIIEIDWENPTEIKKTISLLQNRRKTILRKLGYDQIYFNGSKYNLDSILPAFEEMYQSDFTHLFESSNQNTNFYVYAHCNPLKPLDIRNNIKHLFLASKFCNLKYEPFYIGKGVGERYKDLNRNDSHRKIRHNIKKYNKDIDAVKLLENLDEKKALSFESILIDILGLKTLSNFGLLSNLDEGQNLNERRLSYKNDMIKRILERNGFKI